MGGGGMGGVGFIMQGWEIFKVSLHSWQRGAEPLFYEDPLILPIPTFFKFCPTHPHFIATSNSPPPPPLFFLLSCFFGWIGDHATFDVLFYLMIIWVYTCQALVPWHQKDLDVYFMQQGIRFTEVWHIMWFFTGTLIWYHKHTNAHTTLRG